MNGWWLISTIATDNTTVALYFSLPNNCQFSGSLSVLCLHGASASEDKIETKLQFDDFRNLSGLN